VTSSEVAITNLLYRYAELIDSGAIDEIGTELFGRAAIRLAPPPAEPVSGPDFARLLRRMVVIHPDGTPRTRHVITNPIVEVDEQAGTAACRSYYTVLQQVGSLALQPVAAGRYHDRFARASGTWHFAERDYTMLDLVGDVSHHLIGLSR
jgi:3-phenylpropionate/cinnamic acid dioxygenase small subunit